MGERHRRQLRRIEEELKKILIEFAKKQGERILGISKGIDPEEEFEVHYFLTRGKYDEGFSDSVSELELYLFDLNPEYEDCVLSCFPVSPEKINEYPFLGDLFWRG